jgi:hypothetical protein
MRFVRRKNNGVTKRRPQAISPAMKVLQTTALNGKPVSDVV